MGNKRRRHCLRELLFFGVLLLGIYTYVAVASRLPDQIRISVNEQEEISVTMPFFGSFHSESTEVVLAGRSNVPKEEVYITGTDTLYVSGNKIGEYDLVYRLFGLVDFKSIRVKVVEEKKVIPCGIPVGLYLKTDGILVIGTTDVVNEAGEKVSPVKNKLLSGDYIVEIDHVSVNKKQELVDRVKEGNGSEMELTILRGQQKLQVLARPQRTLAGTYQLGVWVRDDCQGIGTLTFLDEKGQFGALGHAINDIDIGRLINVSGGAIRLASIHSIIKGRSGVPGSLAGSIGYGEEDILGEIRENNRQGVYGKITDNKNRGLMNMLEQFDALAVSVAHSHEIEKGKAYIRCFFQGQSKDYEIEITDLNQRGDLNKGITFRVIDPRLLELTGGIVQGMSGSPILQKGKLIGAVTHVFVQDASRGYGIYIENMLEHIQ